MNGRVYVSFEGTLVSVASSIPDVTSWVSFCFRAMLADRTNGRAPASSLEVVRTGSGFALNRDGQTLLEAETLVPVLQRTRHEVIQAHVDNRRELLWLHAGAVASEAGAVLLIGPTGSGKSSLTARLVETGWFYLSDDIAPLHPETFAVHPYPLTPFTREHTGEPLGPDGIASLDKVTVNIAPDRYAREPSPVRALVFPVYDPDHPGIVPVTPGPASLRLLAQGINTRDLGEAAVRTAAGVNRENPAFELHYADPTRAVTDLLEHLGTP